jgi:aminoglycoside phosphotransferase (APT) family kinase protein
LVAAGAFETRVTMSASCGRLAPVEITTETVRRLVDEQLPQWGELPVSPVLEQGNDNRTFRLGEDLAVRLPSAERYVAGVAKEDRCLPLVAAHLSTEVPASVATGVPGASYPFPWSVRRWIPGTTPDRDAELDRVGLAEDLGLFLRK